MSRGNMALVEAIEEELQRPMAESVRAAFLAVDRKVLVPFHYEQQAGTWIWQETGEEAYQDRQLVVQVTNHLPSSSSSRPSLMAVMLEALDVQPGQRVLEIGTGTGYHAALMGQLVGSNGHVTSIDIDEALVRQAQQRLVLAGATTVVTEAANGFHGYEPHAPYDRIIATAGVKTIPQAWCDQLSPDGLLVVNVLWPVVRPLLALRKMPDATLSGTLLPSSAVFMEMHHGQAPRIESIDWETYDRVEPVSTVQDEALLRDLHRNDVLLFLSLEHNTIQRHWRPIDGKIAITLIDLADKSSMTIKDTTIIARGSLIQTVNMLRQSKIPAVDAYQIHYQQGHLSVQAPGTQKDIEIIETA